MSISNGHPFLSIPGPTPLPDPVLGAMHQQAVEINTKPLVDTTMSILADLKSIFATTAKTYIYIANGHGAWEAALANVMSRGETVLVAQSGIFANSWGVVAKSLGVNVEHLEGDMRSAVKPDALAEYLARDVEKNIKAILVVQIDTASGVVNDIKALREAIDSVGHPALLMVDTIASLGVVPFKMDEWGVDLAVAASQKGLMSPPGLSFIAAGDRAQQAHQNANLVTNYWDWTLRNEDEHYRKFCGTPPEQYIFALRKAIDLIFEEGLDAVFARHAKLARAVRAAVSEWSKAGHVSFQILEPEQRSDAVTSLQISGASPQKLLGFVHDYCGVSLGGSYGELAEYGFRIGHMGHINAPHILGTLGATELGLKALGLIADSGMAAAIAELMPEADEMTL